MYLEDNASNYKHNFLGILSFKIIEDRDIMRLQQWTQDTSMSLPLRLSEFTEEDLVEIPERIAWVKSVFHRGSEKKGILSRWWKRANLVLEVASKILWRISIASEVTEEDRPTLRQQNLRLDFDLCQ